VLRVSTSLSTTPYTRHGQTLHNNTLGAAFHGATALHGIKPMGGNGVCPHALTLRWHRGHVCNPHDRGVRSTMDWATEAARWVGAGRDRERDCYWRSVGVACTHSRTFVGGG
jgi:hypothetical protein